MSTRELQTQIDTISKEIEQQKQLLKTLERSKSTLQRRLNAVLDPIARLPIEISSAIFVQCLPSPAAPEARFVPMLLLNVCNIWTDIALSTPSLWATIHINLPCGNDFRRLLEIWFERAGTHLLDITVTGPLDTAVAALIWRRSSRLSCLELSAEERSGDWDDEDDREFRYLLPGGTQPEALPALRRLKIRGREDLSFSRLPILEILRLSANLVELKLTNIELSDPEDDTMDPLVLPNLRTLRFLRLFEDPAEYTDYVFLKYISTPRLEALGLSLTAAPGHDQHLLSFLQRSSPPLRVLEIGETKDSEHLSACFALTPALTRLFISWPQHAAVHSLFTMLAQPQTPLALPDLRNLRIDYVEPLPDSLWSIVLDGLSARRTQIREMRITYMPNSTTRRVPPGIVAAFREICTHTYMDIWVGSTEDTENNELYSSE